MKELEKILEEIENERTDIDDYSDAKSRMLVRHWNSCIDVVEDIIRKHMNDGWIPVEERLPEDDGEYCTQHQIMTKYGVTEGWYRPNENVWYVLFVPSPELSFFSPVLFSVPAASCFSLISSPSASMESSS